jgi:hypothetical protein
MLNNILIPKGTDRVKYPVWIKGEMTMQSGANTDVCDKSCGGNCERDFDKKYDGSQCSCVACPNVKLCGSWLPSAFLGCHRGRCMKCAITWDKTLSFVEMTEECPICFNSIVGEGVCHPSDCDHVFCTQCTKRLYWGLEDEDEYDEDEYESDEQAIHTTCPLCRKDCVPDWFQGYKERLTI